MTAERMRMEDRGTTRPEQNTDSDRDPEDFSNSLLRNTRCCFLFPCLSSQRSSGVAWWQRMRHEDRWWTRTILKLREWSEIIAGPRWKTFIRRFNRNNHRYGGGCCGGGGGDQDRHGHGQFQYDALSYALNFDEGPVVEDGDVDEDRVYGGFRSFSTRYAAVPPGNKKTIGGGDGSGGKTEVGSLVA